jgi:hypothetical protein
MMDAPLKQSAKHSIKQWSSALQYALQNLLKLSDPLTGSLSDHHADLAGSPAPGAKTPSYT